MDDIYYPIVHGLWHNEYVTQACGLTTEIRATLLWNGSDDRNVTNTMRVLPWLFVIDKQGGSDGVARTVTSGDAAGCCTYTSPQLVYLA